MKSKLTQFHIRPARPDEAGLFFAQNGTKEKPLVGRVTYANGDTQEFTDADEFLRCVQEELPYRPTTGFRYEVLTDDPYAPIAPGTEGEVDFVDDIGSYE